MCGANIYYLPALPPKDKTLQLQRPIGRSSALLVLCPLEGPGPLQKSSTWREVLPRVGMMGKREERVIYQACEQTTLKKHTAFQKKDSHAERFMKYLSFIFNYSLPPLSARYWHVCHIGYGVILQGLMFSCKINIDLASSGTNLTRGLLGMESRLFASRPRQVCFTHHNKRGV